MNPEEILEVIQGIGEMLEPSAQAAWDIAMRQVQVEAVQFLFFALLCIAVAVAIAVSMAHELRREHKWPSEIDVFFQVVGLAVSLPVACLLLSAFYGRMVNPAYYVISWLLRIVP